MQVPKTGKDRLMQQQQKDPFIYNKKMLKRVFR
jgi:hypothetical protein